MIEFFKKSLNKLYEVSGFDQLTIDQVLQFILILIGVILLELILVGWKRSSLKKIIEFDKSTRIDLTIWLFEMFNLFTILTFLFTLGICYFLVGILQKNVDFHLIDLIENGGLQFLIVYIISDFKEYVKHYVFHKFKPFWAVHELHHSATNFNIFTAYRFHFLQSAFGMFFNVIPFVILGVPIQTFFAIEILRQVHGLIIHSNIEHSWGFIGKYILVSPMAHRIHHSIKKEHHDKNFGGTFIIWDRIFGTYHAPTEVTELGIPDNPYNKHNAVYGFGIGMKRFFKASWDLVRLK